MNVTRNGKIARLPLWIRAELNQRLQDGELGSQLVQWLNGHASVQEVLKEQFGGRPVSEQNLSEWKSGGYQDWLRQEETRLLVSRLTEQSDELDEAADGQEISDRFAGLLAVELTRLAATLLEKETDPEKRWKRLCEVHRELSQLRRDDHRAVRTLIKRERWVRKTEREDEEEEKRRDKEDRQRRCAPFWAGLELNSLAEYFGGGDAGRNIAAFILEMQNDLRVGRLGRVGREAAAAPSKPDPAKPDQTESNQTKPDQTDG
jgi:hypothetical protein